MGITVNTADLKQWERLLASEVSDIVARVQPALTASQRDIQNRAQAAAPHRTGALRGSIRPIGRGLRRTVKAGNARAYYARFQEFGTGKMTANPFLLRQANAQAAAELESKIAKALTRGAVWR